MATTPGDSTGDGQHSGTTEVDDNASNQSLMYSTPTTSTKRQCLFQDYDEDGFDVEKDPVKLERRRFLDEYGQRRVLLIRQLLPLLEHASLGVGAEGARERVDRTLYLPLGEALLMLGLFVAQYVGIDIAAALLFDKSISNCMPYIFVVEYAIDEYDEQLDAPESRGTLRKHCVVLDSRQRFQDFESRLVDSKRRFVINRCWLADVRRWSLYVVPGVGTHVSYARRDVMHHLDPDLCAPHHWIDSYDKMDFDALRQYTRDDSVVEQRDAAVFKLLGMIRVNKLRDIKCVISPCPVPASPPCAPSSSTATTTTTIIHAVTLPSQQQQQQNPEAVALSTRKRTYVQSALQLVPLRADKHTTTARTKTHRRHYHRRNALPILSSTHRLDDSVTTIKVI